MRPRSFSSDDVDAAGYWRYLAEREAAAHRPPPAQPAPRLRLHDSDRGDLERYNKDLKHLDLDELTAALAQAMSALGSDDGKDRPLYRWRAGRVREALRLLHVREDKRR
jgi:hypothetical protein